MSDTPKRPYAQVVKIAEHLKERLQPHCDRLEIAGSLRRKKELVGDIELVAIPKIEVKVVGRTLFGEETKQTLNHLHHFTDDLLERGLIAHTEPKAWGENYRRFNLTTKAGELYKVDLFMCRPDNWGVIFLIRTGSQEFSSWAVTEAHKWGPLPPGYQVAGGQLWCNNQPVPCPEEQVWFDLLGIPFVEPEKRTDRGVQ